jgi:hypothetical protein
MSPFEQWINGAVAQDTFYGGTITFTSIDGETVRFIRITASGKRYPKRKPLRWVELAFECFFWEIKR